MTKYSRLVLLDTRVNKYFLLLVLLICNIVFLIVQYNNLNVTIERVKHIEHSLENYAKFASFQAKQYANNLSYRNILIDDKWDKLMKFLSINSNFFILEPFVLKQILTVGEWDNLRFNFNLTQRYIFNSRKQTIGVFADNVDQKLSMLKKETNYDEYLRITDTPPYTNAPTLTHLFVTISDQKIHIVIFHPVKNYLWIGKISEFNLPRLLLFNIHYGHSEEIYDPFTIRFENSLNMHTPDDPAKILSQMPTSRFMHCTTDSFKWIKQSNLTVNEKKNAVTLEAIIGLKKMMWEFKMEFWIVCGTLLGWYRQCGVTPYTSDTDFATWSKYLTNGWSVVAAMKKEAPKHNLRILNRFGEPTKTLELSFRTYSNEKLDLFVIYDNLNETHYMMPYHVPWRHKYVYSIYPKYELCSVELLGYKVLAPCNPETIILTEYGSQWKNPISTWDYNQSPKNSGPELNFNFKVDQHQSF